MASHASIREQLEWNGGYDEINREERNIAAIFYHALLLDGNLQRFLSMIGCDHQVVEDEMGIFFEYAYLRDLWKTQITSTEQARQLILECLDPPNRDELAGMSVLEFNTYFGAVPKPSDQFVQSPGNWSIERYKGNIHDDELFLKVCRFKWAFNAKPDIVIHTSYDSAVCIEAKFESGEGQYPTKPAEKAEFKRRGLSYVGQTELQAYILKELLGVRTQFVFLVQNKKASSDTHQTVTWSEVFAEMRLDECPLFIQRWSGRV